MKHITFDDLAWAATRVTRAENRVKHRPTIDAMHELVLARDQAGEMLAEFVRQADERSSDAAMLKGLADRRRQ